MESYKEMYKRPETPFRCPSVEDFNERSKHLAFLLDATLPVAQDLLADIYGFNNSADLLRDLRNAEKSPDTHPPGPFDEDDFSRSDTKGGVLSSLRSNYSLEAAAKFAQTTIGGMPKHFWKICEMGLFSRLKTHRVMVKKVRLDMLTQPASATPSAFDRWFGDSQVVDENGTPKVMYHGAPHHEHENGTLGGFDVFDRLATTKIIKGRKPGMDTVGIWFSDLADGRGAGMYAGSKGSIYPVYLSVRNPWRPKSFEDFLATMHREAGSPIRSFADARKATVPFGRVDPEPFRFWLQENGYDGIAFPKGTVDGKEQSVWIALEPNQIKSAIGNPGTFDPNNPSIIDAIEAALVAAPETTSDEPTRNWWHNDLSPHTPSAFDRWFGDSRVVDDNGEPLVVYHGTTEYFSTFSEDRIESEGGFFFSSSRQHAAEYVGDDDAGHVMEVYLSIANPYTISNYDWGMNNGLSPDEAKAAGHDGYQIKGQLGGDTWIAFRPEQIKSIRDTSNPLDLTRDSAVELASRNQEQAAKKLRAAEREVRRRLDSDASEDDVTSDPSLISLQGAVFMP